MFRKRGQDIVDKTVTLRLDHRTHRFGDHLQLEFGRPTVQREIRHAGGLLPLQSAHALSEELIQVARSNGNELQALQ